LLAHLDAGGPTPLQLPFIIIQARTDPQYMCAHQRLNAQFVHSSCSHVTSTWTSSHAFYLSV
jgi:hypothetical protein